MATCSASNGRPSPFACTLQPTGLLASVPHLAITGQHDLLQRTLGRLSRGALNGQLEPSQELGDTILAMVHVNDPTTLGILLRHASSSIPLAKLNGGSWSTALILAADDGRDQCVRLLLQHDAGSQVAATDVNGANALICAVESGHQRCVALLLQQHPRQQVTATDNRGRNALIVGVQKDHVRCVELLLEHHPGQQLAATDREGNTALILASKSGHSECVSLLLEHSPKKQVEAIDADGATALMLAAENGHDRCVEVLLRHYPEQQVKATNFRRDSALVCAAKHGHVGCVKLLLQHLPEKQVEATNTQGESALFRAVQAPRGSLDSQVQCIALLLRHSYGLFDVSYPGPSEEKPLSRFSRRKIRALVITMDVWQPRVRRDSL